MPIRFDLKYPRAPDTEKTDSETKHGSNSDAKSEAKSEANSDTKKDDGAKTEGSKEDPAKKVSGSLFQCVPSSHPHFRPMHMLTDLNF